MEVRYISTYKDGQFAVPVAAYTNYGKGRNPEYKLFCIHKTPRFQRKWTITHVPSGVAFGKTFPSRWKAVNCLNKIMEFAAFYGDSFVGDFYLKDSWASHNSYIRKFYIGIVRDHGGR
jgi:hypothetical protein